MDIDGKKFNAVFLLLLALIISSVAWYSSAQEQATTQNNIFLDSDQDGMTDDEEKTYGTDPNSSDTDKDGYSDGSEIKSGYDPLKPAPGDKIAPAVVQSADAETSSGEDSTEENMTMAVAEKIATLAANGDPESADVSLDEIDTIVDEALNGSPETAVQAAFTEEDLTIKEQELAGLSEEEIKKIQKEDFSTYIAQVFYILSSNSPKPITSSEDISSLNSQLTQTILSAISSRSTSSLGDLTESGEKMLQQMKEVEVPEDLADIHLKALNFASYATGLEEYINPNTDDPVKDIANFSQIEAFLTSLMDFSQEAQAKFSEYGLTYDETMQKKLMDLGIDLEEPESDQNTANESSDSE